MFNPEPITDFASLRKAYLGYYTYFMGRNIRSSIVHHKGCDLTPGIIALSHDLAKGHAREMVKMQMILDGNDRVAEAVGA